MDVCGVENSSMSVSHDCDGTGKKTEGNEAK